jgi:hypothetical protein
MIHSGVRLHASEGPAASSRWALGHDRLFQALAETLVPSGRLEAQRDGGPNLAQLRARAEILIRTDPYARYLEHWHGLWPFADPE